MKILIKFSSSETAQNIIDIFFINNTVEGRTKCPEYYIEEYERMFHEFCTDIFNFIQSLELKNTIKIVYEVKLKNGNISELGYRKSTRSTKQESYYIPFHVIVNGKPTSSQNHLIQVRISTHKPRGRNNETLISYTIKDWRKTVNYERHKRNVKYLIQCEIDDKVKSLKS